ncbi:MAG: hypothetical protein M1820_010482 [Bogoriella megaspora]|nr:MAG: hypothetical protein M1820_010482 [Bogoriella megaspora]
MAGQESGVSVSKLDHVFIPESIENTAVVSEAFLIDALAKLGEQVANRNRPNNNPIHHTLGAHTTSSIPTNQDDSAKIRPLRTRASSAQGTRISNTSSGSGPRSNSLGASRDRRRRSPTETAEENQEIQPRKDSNRESVLKVNAGVSEKIIRFEELANQSDEILLVPKEDTNGEDTQDNLKSKALPALPFDKDRNSRSRNQRKSRAASRDISPLSEITTIPLRKTSGASEDLDVTALRLRSGSVLTVLRPEQTAWQRFVYIQGPIRLREPEVVPRKGSIASMYPFQDVVEPEWDKDPTSIRRTSDDAVIDGIIDFFESFNMMPAFEDCDKSSIECRASRLGSVRQSMFPTRQSIRSAKQTTPRISGTNADQSPRPSTRSSQASFQIEVQIEDEWEGPPRLHLDVARRSKRSSKSETSPRSPRSPKKPGTPKKRQPPAYKATKLGRLTSII